MKAKRVKRIAGKVGRTALDVGKLYLAYETGGLKQGNEAVLDIAKTWAGKDNILQRKEDELGRALSKNKMFRVARDVYGLTGASKGDYTGAYKSSADLAKEVLGKKMYEKSGAAKVDRSIEKYVLPTAQYAQDTYKLYKNVKSLPGAVSTLRTSGGVRNALKVGLKAKNVYTGSRKVSKPFM